MDLTTLFANATPETIVRIRYRAGRPATPRAIEEFRAASDWKKPSDEYIGHFGGLFRNRKGQEYIILFVHNRGETGAVRCFNPSVGLLLEVNIVTE